MASSVLDTRLSLLDKVFGASSRWTSETISVHECSLAVETAIPIRARHFAQNLNFSYDDGTVIRFRM